MEFEVLSQKHFPALFIIIQNTMKKKVTRHVLMLNMFEFTAINEAKKQGFTSGAQKSSREYKIKTVHHNIAHVKYTDLF